MSSPDTGVADRMRAALAHGAGLLDVVPTGRPLAWGWRGRTIGAQVIRADQRPAWLRVLSALPGKRDERIWSGTEQAAALVPDSVPRPVLIGQSDWTTPEAVYRAELTSYIPSPALSAEPVLRTDLDLPDAWWSSLRASLGMIAATPTQRQAVTPAYIERALPLYLRSPQLPTRVPRWSTAHGDLHWANLTASGPTLLDWEGWGLAPAVYDIALLAAHTMLVPATEGRLRAEFADLLDSTEGRFAELVVLAELLQTTTRGDNLDLAPALHRRAAELIPLSPA
ncbi:phosphotransferase [Sphaerisporangium sp. NPDC049003]|uniref:phosphotransferase n=1 Tax=Sphaerisporangium sp. NPDC049003 TaxID=3364517 RepID=UPI0037130B2C